MLDQPTFFDAFERLNPPVAWSTEEVDRLFQLRVVLGWGWDAIARDMGRTESGVKSKFKAVVHSRAPHAPSMPGVREPVPESVLNEQARRIVAWGERGLTATVLGDPPLQFSALAARKVA